MKYFTHLHLHTSYSLNSGTIKIDDLINTAKKRNISSLAMTDHLNIFGAVKFYNKFAPSLSQSHKWLENDRLTNKFILLSPRL